MGSKGPKFRIGQVVRLQKELPELDEFVKIRDVHRKDGLFIYKATNYMLGGLQQEWLRPLTSREANITQRSGRGGRKK